MPPQGAEQLVVRQHERYHCRFAVDCHVGEETSEQVVLARAVGDGAGSVSGYVVDCSRGGLGLETTEFFPRGARLIISLKSESPATRTVTQVRTFVRVQRVTMINRKPTYYLGVSFQQDQKDFESITLAFMDTAKSSASVQKAPPIAGTPGVQGAPGVSKGGAA